MRIIRLISIVAALAAITGCQSLSKSSIGSADVAGATVPAVAYVASLSKAQGVRPVHVERGDRFMAFGQAYHDNLVSQLTQAGIPVATVRGAGPVVRFDVRPIAYRHAPVDVVPAFTVLGAGLAGASDINDHASLAVWQGLAAGAALDAARILHSAQQRHAGDGNVVVTTQVVDGGTVLWSDSASYLLPEAELANYIAWTPSPAIPTRPLAMAALPVKPMAVTGVADERAERIFRRSLRK